MKRNMKTFLFLWWKSISVTIVSWCCWFNSIRFNSIRLIRLEWPDDHGRQRGRPRCVINRLVRRHNKNSWRKSQWLCRGLSSFLGDANWNRYLSLFHFPPQPSSIIGRNHPSLNYGLMSSILLFSLSLDIDRHRHRYRFSFSLIGLVSFSQLVLFLVCQ